MTGKWLFAGIGLAALLAGAVFWWLGRPAPMAGPVSIGPAALYAASFTDEKGGQQSLGRFQGKLLVLNFWATWCGPCREEMPGFVRLQSRWAGQGVQFVGLSNEEPGKVARFARELAINYPLWTGGNEVGELSRRLGNRMGVLPHTAIIGPAGEILAVKVGAYSETELDTKIRDLAGKSG